MTDISKCSGEGCFVKETCLRYTAPADEYQSYIEPMQRGRACPYKLMSKSIEKRIKAQKGERVKGDELQKLLKEDTAKCG